MARFEERKVLTLYGDRGWHDPCEEDYNYRSINRGYRSMNDEIAKLAKLVTIHGVSISHIIVPHLGQGKMCRIYAEIVYSGAINLLSVYGDTDPDSGHLYPENNTVFEVYL